MFLGPYEEGGDFRDGGIAGPQRFLSRTWDAVLDAVETGRTGFPDPAVERKLHATVRQVTRDMADLGLNTAIAALMEYLNVIRAEGRTPTVDEVRPLVVMLAPMAPHLCEELWERMGGEPSVFDHAAWPEWDEELIRTDTVELPVQVNGKLRATIRVERGASEEAVREAALAEESVRRHVGDAGIRKTVHIPDRLLNLVVG
jgi:leucyl-tRNA synthetase